MKKILSVREARANFHQVLKMVKNKEDIIVQNQETGEQFRILPVEEVPKKLKQAILKNLSQTGFKSSSPDKIRDILSTRLNG